MSICAYGSYFLPNVMRSVRFEGYDMKEGIVIQYPKLFNILYNLLYNNVLKM